MAQVKRYHEDAPDWRKTTHSKSGQLIGIELEVSNPKGKHAAADALDNFKSGNRRPKPLAEDDSSLDRQLGVELICPPLPLEEIIGDEGYINRLMLVQKEAGTDSDPATNYGMHININMDGWSGEEKLAVQYLLNRFSSIGCVLGRRDTGFGAYIPVFKLVRMPGGNIRVHTYPGGKHAAAHIRRATAQSVPGGVDGTVIEVRLAKSTLEIDNLRIMIDYIYALRTWVSLAPRHTIACMFLDSLAPNGTLEKMFIYWCRKNAQLVYAKVSQFGEVQAKPNRLAVMQGTIKGKDVTFALTNAGIYNDKGTTGPQSAVRISTVLSKGIAVQGELDYEGRIFASTIRPLS